MRFNALPRAILITSTLVWPLPAQEPPVFRGSPRPMGPAGARWVGMLRDDAPHGVIGVSTTSAASIRDTLGVLVSAVRAGSPAEKAGLEEGNRISTINGVSLRMSAADVGDDQVATAMARRLARTLHKLAPGADVELRVFANGQLKTVKIKTVLPAELYEPSSTRRGGDRATLGVGLAVTGSHRDSIGVFVLSVDDGGPAANAGIEEGSRIASINGVDVRTSRTSDAEDFASGSAVRRLEREVSRLNPGDDVDLRIYSSGRARSVKFKAGRVSDFPRRHRSLATLNKDAFVATEIMPRIAMPRLEGDIRHAMELGIAGMGPAVARIGGRVDW